MNLKKLLFVLSLVSFLAVGALATNVFPQGVNGATGSSSIISVRPRLDLRFPRGLKGCGPFDFFLTVTNRGTGTATDVVINVQIKQGQQFVGSTDPTLPFVWNVGNIPARTSQSKNFRVSPNEAWKTAGPQAKIGILATVTQETTNPKHNLRRHDGSTAHRGISCSCP